MKKTVKKALSCMLTLCMLLTLLPAVALADNPAVTVLYVGGTSVLDVTNPTTTITYWKSDGQGGITSEGASSSDYTVKYDPTGTKPTLTLKGATITKTHTIYGNKCGIYVAGSDWPHLDLALIGNNTITGADYEEGNSYGICSGQTSIDITSEAPATLSVSGKSGNSSCGISIGSTVLEISGQAAVIATGGIASDSGSTGVSCSGLTLSGSASLTATGSQAGENSCGVYLTQALTVSAGTTLSATGGTSGNGRNSYGIATATATISGTVTAIGGDASGSLAVESQGTTYGSSYGLHGSTTLNSGGSLTATSGTCHESGKSMAVYSGEFTNSSNYPILGAAAKDGALGAAVYNPTLKTIVTGENAEGTTVAKRVSIAVLPAVTDYNVWVGGVQVTSANRGGITGAGINGTVSFDPATTPATLTLNGASITGARDIGGTKYGIYSIIPLKIVLTGNNNTITGVNAGADTEDSYGLYLNGADLTVSGTGKLEASGGAGKTSAGVYVYKGNITVEEDATLDGTGGAGGDNGSYGVRATAVESAGGVITVSGELKGAGGSAAVNDGIAFSQGINAGASLTLNADAKLTATGSQKAVSCPSITANNHDILGAATINGVLGVASISSTADTNTIVTGKSPAGTTIAKYVYITPYTSWVGDKGFNYADDSTVSGTGWKWDGGSKTLSLSGVDITADRTAICINGNAKIVLEGANRVVSSAKRAISSGGTLTIEGSGTLKAAGKTTGIYVGNELTINSGYITASGETAGIHTYNGIIMNGGHVEATATGNLDRGVYIQSQSFTMNGGYLKASGYFGLYASAAVTVSGGYLEAEGTAGYGIGTSEERLFTNSGGVVKTTGTTYGIDANCSFTGGVTIASGDTKAIDGTVTGSEKHWALAEGVPSDGTELPTTATAIDGTSLVIAKSVTTPVQANGTYTLDGHYLYKADGSAFYLTGTDVTATVTGGSYLKSDNYTACYVGGTITVGDATANHPTLVCETPANTKYALNAKAVDVKANGTLYGCAPKNGYGIYTTNNTAGISSAGQLIGVGQTYGIHTTTGEAGVASTSYGVLSVTGGYVCGVVNTAPTGIKSGVSATGGYISAVSTGAINSYALDAQHGSVSVTGAAALTAANTGSGKAYIGADITDALLKGAASKYGALGTATIDTDEVLLIKPIGTAPTITTTALDGGTVGSPYRTTLQATGSAPITWSVTTGELPAGLTLETATGIISGTPTAAGDAGFTVTATNAAGSDTQELTLTVSARPSPGYTPPAQTVPVIGNTTVNVPVTINNGNAALSVTDAQLDAILAKNPESIDIDLSDAGGVTSAQLPVNMLEALKKDGQAGLSIELPVGNIILAADAIGDLAAQTGGAPVTFTFALGADPVDSYDAKLLKRTTDASFNIGIAVGGKSVHKLASLVGLGVRFELDPEDFQSLERPSVYTIDENGNIEYVLTYLNGDVISFYPPHFSPFYIVDFPFADVSGEAWFNEDVAFVKLAGLFEGTSDTTFSPDIPMTRGMLVTVLRRLEGEPAPKGANAFDDVSAGQYYTEAVTWASENKIVDGYGNGKFGPNDMITREQMAAILWRYAKYKGYDVSAAADLSKFTDEAGVSAYAKAAMSWANATELINGTGGGVLNPGGSAERCHVAAILHRFCAGYEK